MKSITKGGLERSLFITTLTAVVTLLSPAVVRAQAVCLICPPNNSSYTISVAPGWSLIANPIYHLRGMTGASAVLDNSVGELFKRVPTGTRIYKFDNATERFTENVFLGNHWTKPNQTLSPGEGAFILNPKARSFKVIITGDCGYGGLELPKGLSLISSPACGNINFAPLVWPPSEGGAWPPGPPGWWNNLGFNPQEGDEVFTFSNASQSYQIHRFGDGTWDSQPSVATGESCFVRTALSRQISYTAPRPY